MGDRGTGRKRIEKKGIEDDGEIERIERRI
jgi:hypothetical protein